MMLVETARELRESVATWKRDGLRVGFVPTMGNLHAGHLSLIALARANADRVVASVFVNPTQFGPNEDFGRYPRTLAEDTARLDAAGCDMLFAPSVEEMYPRGTEGHVRVEVPAYDGVLDGEFRPGHFSGVATVVAKLFGFVQPDVAVFGLKDYQQLMVVRRVVADLAMPIAIVAGPTQREADGLAMSSRNQYLAPGQRAQATLISVTLRDAAERVRRGDAFDDIEREGRSRLEEAGFQVDYVSIRDAGDLSAPPAGQRAGLVALVAARLGTTRLIDNLLI